MITISRPCGALERRHLLIVRSAYWSGPVTHVKARKCSPRRADIASEVPPAADTPPRAVLADDGFSSGKRRDEFPRFALEATLQQLRNQPPLIIGIDGAEHSAARRPVFAATSAMALLRQIGASIGVAALGALVTTASRPRCPRTWTRTSPPRSTRSSSRSCPPVCARRWVPPSRPVFGLAAPLLVLALVLVVALPALPPCGTAHASGSSDGRTA
jgi:hypothetical protein